MYSNTKEKREELRNSWIEKHKIKASKGVPCLRKLSGIKCNHMEYNCLPSGCDHTSMWNQNGKPFAVVTQPYQLDVESLESMIAMTKEFNLQMYIAAKPSWHFHGEVVSVIFERKKTNVYPN